MTNARIAALHRAVGRLVCLSTPPRSTPQNRALVTSGNLIGRISGGLPSAARRRRYAPAPFPPSLHLRSTLPARRPQTEALRGLFLFQSFDFCPPRFCRSRNLGSTCRAHFAPLLWSSSDHRFCRRTQNSTKLVFEQLNLFLNRGSAPQLLCRQIDD